MTPSPDCAAEWTRSPSVIHRLPTARRAAVKPASVPSAKRLAGRKVPTNRRRFRWAGVEITDRRYPGAASNEVQIKRNICFVLIDERSLARQSADENRASNSAATHRAIQ
jgi:hypothetical protein